MVDSNLVFVMLVPVFYGLIGYAVTSHFIESAIQKTMESYYGSVVNSVLSKAYPEGYNIGNATEATDKFVGRKPVWCANLFLFGPVGWLAFQYPTLVIVSMVGVGLVAITFQIKGMIFKSGE